MKTFTEFTEKRLEEASLFQLSNLSRILEELGGTKLYDPAMDLTVNFTKNSKKTVDDIIKLIKRHPDVNVGYTISNLESFRRKL